MKRSLFVHAFPACLFWILVLSSAPGFGRESVFTDGAGKTIRLEQIPVRVVSLVPSVTEMLFELGADTSIAGITHHTVRPWQASRKTIVGGFSNPSLDRIQALDPDLIFYSDIHGSMLEAFEKKGVPLVRLKTGSIRDSLDSILLLGRIFGREERARAVVEGIQTDLEQVRRKLEKAGIKGRRVIRLMGRDKVMTPGRDSFQNEMITLAGGIPPDFGPGQVVPVSEAQWRAFNPEVIYGCGDDRKAADLFFPLPGWKDVDAVQNGRVYYFPCDLTCRASVHTGDFVQWLAAVIHGKALADPAAGLEPNRIVSVRPLETPLDWVRRASVKEILINDVVNKSLVIELDRPMTVLSTLDGWKSGVRVVGNTYIPPETWLLNHDRGLEAMKQDLLDGLGLSGPSASFLFTGADMDHLSVQTEKFRDMEVTVFATAGVDSNAMRVSRDAGEFYEPGTINIIVAVNQGLTPRAMSRAVITATEGKTAALLDLDVRTSYGRGRYRATGTGTDNVMVVEGAGQYTLDGAGGHTRLGELIGRCVYKAVTEAVKKQNALTPEINIFHRLSKRGISIYGLLSDSGACDCQRSFSEVAAEVEALLLDDRFKGFMETALALSDDYDQGLVKDLTLFDALCRDVAGMIAGRTVEEIRPVAVGGDIPTVIAKALDALFTGVDLQEEQGR